VPALARSLALLFAAAAGPAGLAAAQTTWTVRCRYTLSEDGRSWREDLAVTTILRDVIDVRPAAGMDGIDQDYGEAWLIPGLIDLHTHMLLRPYDQLGWDDQVLKESVELRSIRATTHARDTLRAGFVAVRDLGTEGADLADVALKRAIREGLVLGPEIFTTTRAIAATGRYGPMPADPDVRKGAQMVKGVEAVREAVRAQVAAGADWIKVYADFPPAPGQPATPTFSAAELQALCAEAARAGVRVAAHATDDAGIRLAIEAGRSSTAPAPAKRRWRSWPRRASCCVRASPRTRRWCATRGTAGRSSSASTSAGSPSSARWRPACASPAAATPACSRTATTCASSN
jgi:imidazolonepropionase-like amidohydrolase